MRSSILGRACEMDAEMRMGARTPGRWRVSPDLMQEMVLLSIVIGPLGFAITDRSMLGRPAVVDADLPPNSLILEPQD